MSSDTREEIPKFTFQPPKKKIPSYNSEEISQVFLPGITTKLTKIGNLKPNIVSETAVKMTNEHQRYVLYAMNNVDPSLISEKKSDPRSPIKYYSANQLKEIAKSIGLVTTENKKADLAPLILERVRQLRTEGEAQARN